MYKDQKSRFKRRIFTFLSEKSQSWFFFFLNQESHVMNTRDFHRRPIILSKYQFSSVSFCECRKFHVWFFFFIRHLFTRVTLKDICSCATWQKNSSAIHVLCERMWIRIFFYRKTTNIVATLEATAISRETSFLFTWNTHTTKLMNDTLS